jgi:transmembrane sensor
MMKEEEFRELLTKYGYGQASEEEIAMLESRYIRWNETNRLLHTEQQLAEMDLQMWETISKHLHFSKPKVSKWRRLWPRLAAAASILLFLSIGGYFLLDKAPPQIAQMHASNEIVPGSNKAILTLSNGRRLSLTDAKTGNLIKEGKHLIRKTNDGTLSYENDGRLSNDHELTFNIITTPRGGQWSVILPDGTKVLLDAASSIRYPVSFTGNTRKVEVTGQAYFEVVHNAAQPFLVTTKGQVIEVVGTKFNINAYDDEPFIKTTLQEGAVKVSISNSPVLALKPGQQSILQNNRLSVSDANMEEAFAWKNGYISLNNENIESIMRKLSRWYDIDVEYKGTIPSITLIGEIPRNTALSRVLKVLEASNFHFTLEGKKIIITP